MSTLEGAYHFDYSACIFPIGNVDNQVYFFNTEDIDIVWFKGYVDEREEVMQSKFKEEYLKIPYPRLEIDR